MGTGASGPAVGFQGGAASAIDDKQIALAPAAVVGLAPGEKLTSFNPNRVRTPGSTRSSAPSARSSASRSAAARAADQALHLELLRVARRAARSVAQLQDEALARHHRPVRAARLRVADHRGGRARLPRRAGFFANPLVRQAYLGCQWSGPIMGQLNPLEEVNAAREARGYGRLHARGRDGGAHRRRRLGAKHHQREKEHRSASRLGSSPRSSTSTTRRAPGDPDITRPTSGATADATQRAAEASGRRAPSEEARQWRVSNAAEPRAREARAQCAERHGDWAVGDPAREARHDGADRAAREPRAGGDRGGAGEPLENTRTA
jgi:hypothetical protein